MKKVRRIISLLLLSIFFLFLFACGDEKVEQVTLPNLEGKSTTDVVSTLNSLGVSYNLKVQSKLYYTACEQATKVYEYEKFYGYSKYSAGDTVDVDTKVTVFVTAYNIPDNMDDYMEKYKKEKLNGSSIAYAYEDLIELATTKYASYESKDFTTDGYGAVTVTGFVDGDTTRFRDKDGTAISLRYNGVDTPESTAKFEPWGKAASNYTRSCLSNAKKVMLTANQADDKDGNGRYLGWVWYMDQNNVWHVLNLELVAFGYSMSKASDSDTDGIGALIIKCGTITKTTWRRVYGEKDPVYDYSTTPKDLSIEELVTNFGDYYGKKVRITGIVTIMDGDNCCIYDPETKYGVYIYTGFEKRYIYNLKVGNKVTVTLTASYFSSATDDELDDMDEDLGKGSPQLVDLTADEQIVLVSEGNSIDTVKLTLNASNSYGLNVQSIGQYVELSNLVVTKVKKANTGSGYTITVRDASNANGETIAIRVDNSNFTNYPYEDWAVGQTISNIKGYISYYYGYQLVLVYSQGQTYLTK